MRQPLVVANWKMNMTTPEALLFCEDFRGLYGAATGAAELVICPPFTAIETVGRALGDMGLNLGAQDFYPGQGGAFTGEISIQMLKALDCRYIIVGHSERRLHFGETAEIIGEKVKYALAEGVTPIVCVGETMSERSLGMTKKVIGQQLLTCLKNLPAEKLCKIVIAYEPLWAIGSGRSATAEDAAQMALYARQRLQKIFNVEGRAIRILYGGSVTPANIADFAVAEGVDGALVGGASLVAKSFAEIALAYGEKK